MRRQLNIVVRRGDYSPRSSIKLVRNRYGISIFCNPDPMRSWEAPNPRFCGAMAGGRSLATYQVLWHLFNDLPTDERQHAFIPTGWNDGSRFLIMRNSDVVVATENTAGEYGAQVFIKKGSPFFERIKELYRAIEIDNQKEPLWDVLKHPESP